MGSLQKLAAALVAVAFVGFGAGCPEKAAPAAGDAPGAEANGPPPAGGKPTEPAAAGAEAPGSKRDLFAARPTDDKEYVRDPGGWPERLGVTRRFMQVSRMNTMRDPVFLPSGKEVVVMAKTGAIPGLWRMPVDGSTPAELIVPQPLFDPKGKQSARNRGNWFIGTPRVFPDGNHIIFDGTRFSAREKFPNVFGLVSVKGGIIHAVELEGVTIARTPDVHPDGESILFAACTELRTARLKGRGDQVLESTVIVDLPRIESPNEAVCTVHRPRYSKDGKRIVFEVLGMYLQPELRVKHGLPDVANAGDFLIEPWIVNADGSDLRRLIKDETYAQIDGRLQTGGTKEPEFTPDGKHVVFTHGRSIAMVNVEGTQARYLAVSTVDANPEVQWVEGDPAVSPDGKLVVSASTVIGNEDNPKPAPPGLSVIDLEALDVAAGGAP